MSYDHYKFLIEKSVDLCSFERLNQFCRDIVIRMLPYIPVTDLQNLHPKNQVLIADLMQQVQRDTLAWPQIGQLLDQLTPSEDADESEGEIEGALLEFLCAMDAWRDLQQTKAPVTAAAVSESLMNILDSQFVQNVPLENWLSVPPLRDEFARQVQFLKAA